jgi:5,10-methylenetetrahydrofolate reductase
MSKRPFREALASDDFIVTAEIEPPKGIDISEMLRHVDLLKDITDGLNVTSNPRAIMRLSSLAACHLVQERGGEAILQLTCRDQNRISLEAELLGASVLGIRNVLCLSGDPIGSGDHPDATPVFDVNSVGLLQIIEKMKQGNDSAGNKLDSAVNFCTGAAISPESDPVEAQMAILEKKGAAGIEFVQTQVIYDLDRFEKFMNMAREHPVKILAGIMPLTSANMGRFLNNYVAGINVPEALVKELDASSKKEASTTGIEIAARMIRHLREKNICDGIHVMSMGKAEIIPQILSLAS